MGGWLKSAAPKSWGPTDRESVHKKITFRLKSHSGKAIWLDRQDWNPMIKISKSVVGAAELEAMGRVMREDGYLGMGREVRAFEEELKTYLGGQGDRPGHVPRCPYRGPASGGGRRSPGPGMKSWRRYSVDLSWPGFEA